MVSNKGPTTAVACLLTSFQARGEIATFLYPLQHNNIMVVRRIHPKAGIEKTGDGTGAQVVDLHGARAAHPGPASAPQVEQRMPDSVQVIQFPRPMAYDSRGKAGAESGWYLLEIGQNPDSAGQKQLGVSRKKQAIQSQDNSICKRIEAARQNLMAHEIERESGPYADDNGLVTKLALELCDKDRNMPIGDLTDRIGDVLRHYISSEIESVYSRHYEVVWPDGSSEPLFAFTPHLLANDNYPPCAGSVLSDERRIMYLHSIHGFDPQSGNAGVEQILSSYPIPTADSPKFRAVSDDCEIHMVAVSVLRRLGWEAYLARANSIQRIVPPGETQERLVPLNLPVIAIFDPKGKVPLYTTTLCPDHPPMMSLEILSDKEVDALSYALLAQMRIRRFVQEMKTRAGVFDGDTDLPLDPSQREISKNLMMKSGRMPPGEIKWHVSRIAAALSDAFNKSDYSKFTEDTRRYLIDLVSDALSKIHANDIATKLNKPLDECNHEFQAYMNKWMQAGFIKKWFYLRWIRPEFVSLVIKGSKNLGKEINDLLEAIDSEFMKKALPEQAKMDVLSEQAGK